MRTDRSIIERAGLASKLLTDEQIDHAWHVLVESLPAADLSLEEITDQQLAEQLIQLGYLNRWQVEQLLQGRTKFKLGAYRIVDAIGHGGMGWVFKGEHELLGRVEAIKVLPKAQMNPASIESFLREIRAQAKLDHPNLVRLSYADKEGDTYFLVTEFVPGSDLRRLVHYHGPMSQQKAAILVSQAASALEHAHAQGMVHRDVKPGNILITPTGHAKLTDLGLAFFSEDLADDTRAKPKHIVGTADFLAPEIIVTPSEVRPISDIYSLGCTLYYAVTGKVPFPGGDTSDKLRRQLDEVPISPSRLNPQLEPTFVDVIARMMSKRPQERVKTAAEVVELLRPWATTGEATSWQDINEVVQSSSGTRLQEATLAETIPVHRDLIETDRPPKLEIPAILPEGAPPLPTADKPPVDYAPAIDRFTGVLAALAILVAGMAFYLMWKSF